MHACVYVHGGTHLHRHIRTPTCLMFREPSLRCSLENPFVHHFHPYSIRIPIFTVDTDVLVTDHWTHSLGLPPWRMTQCEAPN